MNKLIIVILLYFASTDADLKCDIGNNCKIDVSVGECSSRFIPLNVENNADIKIPVREYEIENINEINIEKVSKYADVVLNNDTKHLTIMLKKEFAKYAETETSAQFIIAVVFVDCSTTKLNFVFNIKETFNHPPEFLGTPYNFSVGTPILPGAEIKGISARDIDFGNKKLTFTICDNSNYGFYFTDSVKKDKIYETILKTKNVVNLEDDITLDICVTDDHTDQKTDQTSLTLTIDKSISKTPDPVFQEPVYTGTYDMETGLSGVIEASLSNTFYEIKNSLLKGDFSEKFQVKTDNNKIIITAKPEDIISEEELKKKKYILLILEAEYDGAEKLGKTVILLDIVGDTVTTTTTTTSTTPLTTITDCPPCSTTTVTEYPTTTVTECPTTTATECPPCATTTVTECPPTTATECPTTACTECPICSTTTVTECPPTTVTECSTTTATECPPCTTSTTTSTDTTCPISTECPVCPDTTTTTSSCDTTTNDPGTITSTSTTTQPAIVKYELENINFEITSSQTGEIGTVLATSSIEEDIEYRIEKTSNDEIIRPNLDYDLNTGVLSLRASIATGIYHITLMATGKTSHSVGRIKLKLTSDAITDCEGKPILSDSLIIKNVKEDEEEEITVHKNDDNYELKITGEKPKWIEERDGSIWIVKPDREDPSLSHMITPQVSVIVEAKKKNTQTNTYYYNSTLTEFARNTYNARDQFENCIHISNIPNSPVRTTIVVIIDDINDNAPVFGDSNPVVVGYPNAQLAEFIAPGYITQVTATDKDSGINALIKYSIEDSKFIVDPYTGIIYPGLGAFEKDTEYEIKVVATDEDGNGHAVEHTIKVKLLNENHIFVLKLKNVAYSNLNEFISKLSKDIGKDVQYLTSTAMSATEDTDKSQKSVFAGNEKISMMKIVAYALDDKHEPIPATELKKLIEGNNLEANVEEYEIPTHPPESSDNMGLIAAVSAVSALLALVIIAVILIYIFFIRPRMVQTIRYEKQASITPSTSINHKTRNTNIYSSVADRRPTGFPAGFKPDDIEAEDGIDETKEKENENKDEGHSEISSNASNEDSDRRKSIVKFDKNVTEIEIEKF